MTEAERLAQALRNCASVDFDGDFEKAAAALLRLQAENDALRAECDQLRLTIVGGGANAD